ncbi:reverse transcriptase [Gossypium australe]|uniref:Reverse transcriptase n=1 Tax=Gossypium australe TaxID=47621 RepID=A0A5B6WH19_9ROSI|nr:reverse transcriptase [Gossypium australe]
MTMVVKGKPMMLYLTSSSRLIGGQEQERSVYYLSRCLHGSDNGEALSFLGLCYTKALTLLPSSQTHCNLLAHFPSQNEEALNYSMQNKFHEDACLIKREWNLYFDGSTITSEGSERIFLGLPSREVDSSTENISLEGEVKEVECSLIPSSELNSLESSRKHISLAFKLDFTCTNNQSKYETLILSLHTANALWKKFQNVKCEHSPRSTNMYVDALATLSLKIHIPKENRNINMAVIKRSLPCLVSELLCPP